MNTLRNAIAILLLTVPLAQAQTGTTPQTPATAQSCTFQEGSPESCVRFVGCIDSDGTYFSGTSVGWHSGTVYGKTSEGEICTGTWENDDKRSKGIGNLNCGKDETAQFKYFARGEDLSVLSGVAISSKGRRMITWAGIDLESYLKITFPNGENPGFRCGKTWVPFPNEFPMQPETAPASE